MTNPDEQQAATEAAQNVVDDVTSYQYSAEVGDIASELDTGMQEAGVEVDEDEKQRLVQEIHDVRHDEDGGTPQVTSATPQE